MMMKLNHDHRRSVNRCRLLAVVMITGCPGCLVPVVIHKADTVLSLQRNAPAPRPPVPVGFQWTHFGQERGRLVIHGSGAFPSEHETYVFWYPWPSTAHPYPDFDRDLRISWSGTETDGGRALCRIEMLLEDNWYGESAQQSFEAYEGSAELLFRFQKAKVSTLLSNLKLRRVGQTGEVLLVSGCVVAERLDSPQISTEDFDKHWTEAVQVAAGKTLTSNVN